MMTIRLDREKKREQIFLYYLLSQRSYPHIHTNTQTPMIVVSNGLTLITN